ncbi:hypothetical protein K474DRAFT_1768816 [Panus rudis PR-1116 ss-1]|nr:hypothetical protein K474DRAFT_1768816 [Panus rudis PR-1116 ss-1]
MSEHHAQNVARGHKANLSNPNTSEESKEHSRQVLEEIEGSSDPDSFTASVGSEKTSNYDGQHATKKVGSMQKDSRPTNEPSRLFQEGEIDSEL